MEQLLSTVTFIALYGLSYGMVLFTISVGLVVTLGLMRVVNLAHGAFAAIGGYVAISLTSDFHLPFALAIILAVAGVALFSILIERLFFVHLYAASELDQVLMTIGLIFVATAGLNLVFGPDVLTAPLPAPLATAIEFGGQPMQIYRLVVIAIGMLLLAGLWFVFDGTSFGARLRAAVDNRTMAQAIGIDVTRLFAVTFALGSGLAALGGAIGFAILPLEPLYPFKYLALVLVVVAISGFGNVKVSAAVAVLVGIVDTAGRLLFPAFGAFTIYIVLITLMLWRDRGLFGWRFAA